MLIKYYGLDGCVYLIDGVTDVMIGSTLSDIEKYPQQENVNHLILEGVVESGRLAKIVSYAKDGAHKLFVYGLAYICNDDGKTIHKVEMERPGTSVVEA